jgi:hypothetical protein
MFELGHGFQDCMLAINLAYQFDVPTTLAQNSVEWKPRSGTEAQLLSLEAFINQLHGMRKAA